jgi:hypothetical protein
MKIRIRFALVAVSVLLIVSLTANGYLFFSMNNELQKQAEHFQSQIESQHNQILNLENQSSNLINKIDTLQTENATLHNEKTNLETQIANFTNQLTVLQQQINNSQNIISSLQAENADLQETLGIVNSPPNIVTSLGVTDVRPTPMLPIGTVNTRLFIKGTVYNTGAKPAYNCSLHVTLYQSGSIIVNTYVRLYTINGHSSVSVETNIPYSGPPLSSWTLIPEYQTEPY